VVEEIVVGLELKKIFKKKCRKGAKFAAHAAFPAVLGKVRCLLSLALEFSARFRGGSFQPLTHLSGKLWAVDSSQRYVHLRFIPHER
jgi:hypothetical protein